MKDPRAAICVLRDLRVDAQIQQTRHVDAVGESKEFDYWAARVDALNDAIRHLDNLEQVKLEERVRNENNAGWWTKLNKWMWGEP